MTRRSIAGELTRAKEGRPRRRVIRGLITELGACLRAPDGVPARSVESVAVAIPTGLDALAGSIDPRLWYRFPLGDDRFAVIGGARLATICGALASLADAQARGDLPGVEEALTLLRVPSWH